MERFTLQTGRWYAAEFLGDEFTGSECPRHFSPIRVDEIHPKRDRQRTFELAFFHANYPEGVRDKRYTLETLERAERFILARSIQHTPPRYVIIYDISRDWLQRNLGIETALATDDLSALLPRLF